MRVRLTSQISRCLGYEHEHNASRSVFPKIPFQTVWQNANSVHHSWSQSLHECFENCLHELASLRHFSLPCESRIDYMWKHATNESVRNDRAAMRIQNWLTAKTCCERVREEWPCFVTDKSGGLHKTAHAELYMERKQERVVHTRMRVAKSNAVNGPACITSTVDGQSTVRFWFRNRIGGHSLTMHVPEVAIIHEDALRPARNSTLSDVGEQANVCQAEVRSTFFLHWNRFRFRLTYEGLRFIESHGIPTLPTTLTLNEPIISMQVPDLASKLTNPEVCTKFDQSNEMKSNVRRAYAYARRESRSRKKNAANRLA